MLIKSFEGLRAQAERLDDGRWVIGYGHTRSAREGAVIGDADAELLLQYDLIPIVAVLERAVSVPLNTHQVDALASYALSIGAERFAASDVVRLVNAGEMEAAAAALARACDTPPNPAPADPVARRRAAEGALFVQDPAQPVALASLLIAPSAPQPANDAAAGRVHAVAVLLGEDEATETGAPDPSAFEAVADFIEAESNPPVSIETAAIEAEPSEPPVAEAVPPEPEAARPFDAEASAAWRSSVALTLQRFSPYSGPLGAAALPAFSAPADGPFALTPQTEVATDRLLVLTPPPEVPTEPPAREVWTEAEREAAQHQAAQHQAGASQDAAAIEAEGQLFGDDLDQGLGVLRHEIEPAMPSRFDWSETGAFLGMGGVGLVAFGASIAGFRLAADQMSTRAFNETTLVSWVLALIGALCVGVAAFNLYLRWRRRDG